MIIGALICECKMIIMDEPTEYLDPIMRNNFFRIIKKYQKKGTTFFISTHNLDEIEKYADFLIVIKDHKIRYCNK
jgi:ABC-2 type transport system ATP-binding protein